MHMTQIVMEYISSSIGTLVNLVLIIAFCLLSYNKYAKRWGALTGRYSTQGRITWSEYGPYNIHTKNCALISYSYSVEGKSYNGTIDTRSSPKQLVAHYPKGKDVTVYFAPKDPEYSRADKPPSHLSIISHAVSTYFVVPVILVNIPFLFIYWLFYIAK